MRNKIFTKIIITTLLVTFLTFNVGRVTRVSAVGTTAAIAATAFVVTGAVYLSYVALTQGQIVLPAADQLHDWLGGIGRKVSQYPSGASAYQEIYQEISREPLTGILDGVWTWTQDRLKSFVNDFADTRIISDILGYSEYINTSNIPYNGFSYSHTFSTLPTLFAPYLSSRPAAFLTLSQYQTLYNCSISFYSGHAIDYHDSNTYWIMPTNITNPVRNLLTINNMYIPQEYYGEQWHNISRVNLALGEASYTGGDIKSVMPIDRYGEALYVGNAGSMSISSEGLSYPLFPQDVIHVQATDEDLPLVIPDSERVNLPTWVDPDNENRPIIPWVPIPDLPTGVPVPPGYTAPPQWGFPLQNLLDLLEQLAEALMSIDAIARLINEFAGQHGDNYYLEYNDGDTNYYTYYQPTIFDNDTEYVTYNIDVSEQDDKIPVDLNTISLYSDNRYLDQIKKSAIAGSSMLRDLAVFWHDVDPEITYIVLGCCILVLIGAFTGKLGHS